VGEIWDELVKYFTTGKSGNSLVDILLSIFVFLFWLLLLLWLGHISRRALQKFAVRNSRNPNLGVLLGNIAYMSFLTLALLLAITFLTGASINNIFTFLGFVGAGLGIALRDVILSIIAGIWILLEKPFKIGDIIKVKEVEGRVTGIHIRTTHLRTLTDIPLIIPNFILFSEIVTNQSDGDKKQVILRLMLPATISYEDLRAQVKEAVQKLEKVDEFSRGEPALYLERIRGDRMLIRIELPVSYTTDQQFGTLAGYAIRLLLPEAEILSIE